MRPDFCFVAQYQWDFDYVGTTFTVDASTTHTLVTHAYNAPGTYRVGVKYMDNDGQWSQPYPFTITIREVRRVFYVKDHLGNIRQSLNESGTVVAAQDYYPYGEFISGRSYISVHPYEKYRFTEKERDIETNLDYFGARYYDSQLGIWGQVDPLWEKYHGWSTYNYTLNNPLNNFDPDGLTVWSISLMGAVGGKEVGGSAGFSWVWDDKGNAGLQFTAGIGCVEGMAFTGTSLSILENKNIDNIHDISGIGYAFGLIFGEGLLAGVEMNGDLKSPAFSLSPGTGPGAAYGLITFSKFIFSGKARDFQDIINNFANGGSGSYNEKDNTISLYDKNGDFIEKVTLDKSKNISVEPAINSIWEKMQRQHGDNPLNGIVPERQPEGVISW